MITAVALPLPFVLGQDVRAQGFLEALFGKGYSPPPSPLRSRSAYIPFDPGTYPQARSADRTGAYRTLCVRHCDGYYWPISSAVPRSHFYRDADVCRQSCGAEASLFYHGARDDAADMVDLTGRSYTALPMAFRYRKSLVDGCKCKPEPWSDSEAERHRAYARDKGANDGGSAITLIAGGPDTATDEPADRVVEPKSETSSAAEDRRDPVAGDDALPPTPSAIPVPAIGSAPRARQPYVVGNGPSPRIVPFRSGPGASRMRWPGD